MKLRGCKNQGMLTPARYAHMFLSTTSASWQRRSAAGGNDTHGDKARLLLLLLLIQRTSTTPGAFYVDSLLFQANMRAACLVCLGLLAVVGAIRPQIFEEHGAFLLDAEVTHFCNHSISNQFCDSGSENGPYCAGAAQPCFYCLEVRVWREVQHV